MRRLPFFVLLLPVLAGCTLMDQTTFAPSPEPKPPPVIVPPPVETRTPLIVIAASATPKDYTKSLREAVRAAEKARHDIDYDVVGVAPATAPSVTAPPASPPSANNATAMPAQPPVASAAALDEAASHAAEVMRAIMAQGVPAARIHLAVRSDPAIKAGEIRVYVR